MTAVIKDNLARVRERMAQAAERAGRSLSEITLVAVTKQKTVAEVQEAILAGVRELGENRVQEGVKKAAWINDWWAKEGRAAVAGAPETLRWHLIGHLQTNKVKYAVEVFQLIHSVDSLHLLAEIDRRAGGKDLIVPVLLEVNVSGEATKAGLPPTEVLPLLEKVAQFEHIRVEGLMTVAPLVADPEETRPVFRGLWQLAERIKGEGFPGVTMTYLSMGMSNDFEVAIEEGANLVRIGTAIFGPRQ